jgi:hypothetical protein
MAVQENKFKRDRQAEKKLRKKLEKLLRPAVKKMLRRAVDPTTRQIAFHVMKIMQVTKEVDSEKTKDESVLSAEREH